MSVMFAAEGAGVFVDDPGTYSGQRGERFDSGPWRKCLLKREPRIDHCSDASGLQVDNNDRAVSLAQRRLCRRLKSNVFFRCAARGCCSGWISNGRSSEQRARKRNQQQTHTDRDADCDLHICVTGVSSLRVLRIESAPIVTTHPTSTSNALTTMRAVNTEISSHARSIGIVWTSRKYGATAKIRNPKANTSTACGANALASVSRKPRVSCRRPRVLVAIQSWIVTRCATTPISG